MKPFCNCNTPGHSMRCPQYQPSPASSGEPTTQGAEGEPLKDHESTTYEAIGRYAVREARWIRHEHEDYAAVPVAFGADWARQSTRTIPRFDALKKAAESWQGAEVEPERQEAGGLPVPPPRTDAEVIAAVRGVLWEALRGREIGGDRTLVGMVRWLVNERDEARQNRRDEFHLREQAEQERDALRKERDELRGFKAAYDMIQRVYDEATALLGKQPKSYLGWNWVHALVDALKQAESQLATLTAEGPAEALREAADELERITTKGGLTGAGMIDWLRDRARSLTQPQPPEEGRAGDWSETYEE